MNESDAYLKNSLRRGTLRPLAGTVYVQALASAEVRQVEGVGAVRVKPSSTSGIIIPCLDTSETENVGQHLYVVKALGAPPEDWHTRFFEKERSWGQTWESQAIGKNTVIAVRPISGVGQDKTSAFKQIRHDEIVAIGRPLDEDEAPDMLPAPGWVMLEMDPIMVEKVLESGLVLPGNGAAPRLEQGALNYGTVVGLPRGLSYEAEGLRLGDRVGIPYHTAVGATERLEFDDNLLAVPLEDIFVVLVDDDDFDPAEEVLA